MNSNQLKALERHQMLASAHGTIAQALKYPQLVAPEAVAKARAVIESIALLDSMAKKPNKQPQ
jgi:hypothetical protein